MVVDDFDVMRLSFLPPKANPILIIDPDAVLAVSVSPESLETFLVPGFIGINFRCPIQTFAGPLIIMFDTVEVEEFQQRLGIVRFAIRSVVEPG